MKRIEKKEAVETLFSAIESQMRVIKNVIDQIFDTHYSYITELLEGDENSRKMAFMLIEDTLTKKNGFGKRYARGIADAIVSDLEDKESRRLNNIARFKNQFKSLKITK
jgi:hypothetical protein